MDQVKVLCRSWFPIEYPDTWYQEITANPRCAQSYPSANSRPVQGPEYVLSEI